MRLAYSLLFLLLLPLIVLRLMLRSIKNPAYRRRMKERFGFMDDTPKPNGYWVHAVSVGEAIAAVKLIQALQANYPQDSITVTCGTPTGSQIIQQQLGDAVTHVYLPYDYPAAVKRFLHRVQPKIGVIMETELWPNLLHYCDTQGIKLLIANMRLSEKSFNNYAKFPKFIAAVLGHIDHFAVQTETDALRIAKLGGDQDKISIAGNLKFEQNTLPAKNQEGLGARLIADRKMWLAASTHEGEDVPVLNAHRALLLQDSDLLLILAPRHPERFEQVFDLSQARFPTLKRSELAAEGGLAKETKVLLLDSIGEVGQLMPLARWSFIGGSMAAVGGHNILEACGVAVPVIFGEHMDNFKQVSSAVIKAEAGMQVANEKHLLSACETLSKDETLRHAMGQRGLTLIAKNQGALGKTLAIISLLNEDVR